MNGDMHGRARRMAGHAFLALVVAATAAAEEGAGYSAAEASRLRREVNLENWDDGGERSRFAYLNISELFPVAVVRRAGAMRPLPVDPNPAIGQYVVEKDGGRDVTLDEVVGQGPFDGFLVVHRGRIVYERYPRMRAVDKHLMFSVTKALVGTVVAILEDRGRIRIERPVGELLSELKGTAWGTISVRDVLEMASGMEGGEDDGAYSDPGHKHYRLEASLGMLPMSPAMPEVVQREDTYRYLSTLGPVRKPGAQWEYASVNTAVLGWLIERVTQKTLAEALADEIWTRLGAEADAVLVVNKNGIGAAHAGLAGTLRDLARFGLLFAGPEAGERVISEGLLRRIIGRGRPQLLAPGARPPSVTHVAYQWDGVTANGEFFKGGFGNQLLYVAPRKGVVIAHFGTNERLGSPPRLLPLRQMIEDLF